MFCLNSVYAQSHNPGPNSNCKLNKNYTPNIEKISCPACDNNAKKEKAAKAAEDKRRADVIIAKANTEKEALNKAREDKLAEDKKNANSGKVYINGNTNVVTKNVTENKKTEVVENKKNYFYTLILTYGDRNEKGHPYWLQHYFNTSSNLSKGFVIDNDTLFRDNQFKKCIGSIPQSPTSEAFKVFKVLNFPPNIGIVILNEEKNITWTNSYGTHSKMYPISDLIDIKGNRLLNDDNITAILHFVDDYFILYKGSYYKLDDYYFDDAVIYNYKTKETYPMHKLNYNDRVQTDGSVSRPDNYRVDMSPVYGTYKAFTGVKSENGEIIYYITVDGRIKEQQIR